MGRQKNGGKNVWCVVGISSYRPRRQYFYFGGPLSDLIYISDLDSPSPPPKKKKNY